MKRLTLVMILSLAFAGMAFGHAGTTHFVPTVPDPTAMNIDGDDADWGWHDDDFATFPDDIVDINGRAPTSDGDYSALIRWGWTPPPDNGIYFFTRVFDDTLRAADYETKGDWWNSDNLSHAFDFDHGGGVVTGNSEVSELENGYRIHIAPFYANAEVGMSMGGLAGDPAESPHWSCCDPWGFMARILLPADADHLSANVEYSIEYKIHPHDVYDPAGPDNTVPHVNAADQIVHLAAMFEDGDGPDNNNGHRWIAAGGEAGDVQWSDNMVDHILIQTVDSLEGYPCGSINGGNGDPRFAEQCASTATAVDNATWARIKSHISK